MADQFEIVWHDAWLEPKGQPNPAFPEGIDLDLSKGEAFTCVTDLPYPARRCGGYSIICGRDIELMSRRRPGGAAVIRSSAAAISSLCHDGGTRRRSPIDPSRLQRSASMIVLHPGRPRRLRLLPLVRDREPRCWSTSARPSDGTRGSRSRTDGAALSLDTSTTGEGE